MRIKEVIEFLKQLDPELEMVNGIYEDFETVKVEEIWMYNDYYGEAMKKTLVSFKTQEDIENNDGEVE